MKLDKINNVLIIVILIIIFKIIYNFLQNKNNIETFYNWKLNNYGELCNDNDNFGSCYNIALIENGNIIDVHGGSAVIVAGPQGSRGAAGAQGADGSDGSRGAAGAPGAAGSRGAAGAAGADGDDGAPGAAGAQGAVGADGSQNFMVNKVYYLFNLTQNTFVRLNGGGGNTQSYLRNTTLVPNPFQDPSEALNVNFSVKVRPMENNTDESPLIYNDNYYINIRDVGNRYDHSLGVWGTRKLKLTVVSGIRVAATGHASTDGRINPFRFKFISTGSNQFKIEHTEYTHDTQGLVSLGQLKANVPDPTPPNAGIYGNEYDFVTDNTGDVFTFIDPENTLAVEEAIDFVRGMTPLAGAGAFPVTYTPTVYNPGTINTINQIGNAFNNDLQTQTAGGFWDATEEQRTAMVMVDGTEMPSGNSIDIEVTFTTPQIVTMYRIWARPGFKHQAPRRWTLIGIDETNVDPVEVVLDYQGWVKHESYPDTVNNTLPSDNPHTALEFSFNNTTSYSKYVFSIIDTNRGTNSDETYCSIGELGLYGTEIQT